MKVSTVAEAKAFLASLPDDMEIVSFEPCCCGRRSRGIELATGSFEIRPAPGEKPKAQNEPGFPSGGKDNSLAHSWLAKERAHQYDLEWSGEFVIAGTPD